MTEFENESTLSHAEKIEFLLDEFENAKNGLSLPEIMEKLEGKNQEHGIGEEVTMDIAIAFVQELEEAKKIERVGTVWKILS